MINVNDILKIHKREKTMRILILLTLLAIGTASPCFARPPEWSEFCPDEYINAQVGTVHRPSTGRVLASSLFWPAMLGTMNKAQKARKQEEANYWVKRRIAFENALEECNKLSEPGPCYRELRTQEDQRNASHQMDNNMKELNRGVRAAR